MVLLFKTRRSARREGSEATLEVSSVPQSVMEEEGAYFGAMFKAGTNAVVFATLLIITGAIVAGLSQLGTSAEASPKVALIALAPSTATAGSLALLPVAVALQVLLRLPRDREHVSADAAVAHRQFWGSVAAILSIATTYLGINGFLTAFISQQPTGQLNFATMFGAPLVALLTTLLALDATVLAQREAAQLDLVATRRKAQHEKIQQSIASVGVTRSQIRRKHPLRTAVFWALGASLPVIVVGVLISAAIFQKPVVPVIYATASIMATGLCVGATLSEIPAILRTEILDFTARAFGSVVVVIVLSAQAAALTLRESLLFPPIGQTLTVAVTLIAVPLPAAVAICSMSRRPAGANTLAPLLEYGLLKLERERDRLDRAMSGNSTTRPLCDRLALAAISTCLIPPLGFAFAAVARWYARPTSNASRALSHWSWGAPTIALLAYGAALTFLPVYGSALGWFTVG